MANQDRAGTTRLASSARGVVHAALLLAAASVSSCTTGDVFALQPAVDVGAHTASVAPSMAPRYVDVQPQQPLDTMDQMTEQSAPVMQSAPLEQPEPVLAAYPRLDPPMSTAPRYEAPTAPDVMPADEIACRQELKRLKVAYRDLPRIGDGGSCGIDYPVQVTAIGSVGMKPAATLTCNMAATFATWTRKELVPAARTRYFSGVRTIHQGSSYSCRKIAGSRVLSEHGKGNALDIMSIELNNGKDIDVRKPGLFAFRERSLLNTVRADGCQYFNTVLGPGYNKDHADHFHFDVKARRNGYVACR